MVATVSDPLGRMGFNLTTEKFIVEGTGKFIVNTTNFKLSEGGDVSVTGTITATGGKIGGVSIDSTGKIYTDYFSVEADGKLKCTEANISGTITAKSGKIGVVNISSTGALVTPYWNITADGKLWCSEARIIGEITATSGTFDNCTINQTCDIKGKLVGAYGQFGAWEIAAYGGYDLICKQSVDVLFEMINTKHNTRSIVLRTTNGLSTSQGDGSTDSVPMVRVVTDNGVGGEFTANNSGGYALKAYGYNGATALYVSGLSYFSGNVSMSLYTTIPTIKGYLYRDSNGFVKIKI